ncbi:LysR family transcriptional regulator [Variovorax sp. Sphag1AA]|uniref:LysR family transcriptional regulator n=1 Tax=Variovorax sp. Sphag1AA TaxID=2587027 RepID=UPI00160C8E43|nr:LysR family transcriptional regulator [Variovorax sp. Sphag1AA]MBB3181516.1 DNA-binding transcriptional LysR family regulator [Variovorax sp. Sphag1AA]
MTRTTRHSRQSIARRLRFQQLLIFEKVVEAGSILAASRELAMTQPAVSKAVHEIEEQLGGALFVRSKYGVALTDFGGLFERHAKSMLAELRYLAEDLNASQTGVSGHVIVGTLIAASATLLPQAITRLRQAAPDVAVTVRVGPNSALFPALARGELDVVVGALPGASSAGLHEADRARLTHVPLYDEALRVVVGVQHPLARRRKIQAADLQEQEWIVPTSDSVAYGAVRHFFEQQGLSLPRQPVESISILTNLELLRAGSMVALMPQSAAMRFAKSGLLAVLPMEGLGTFGGVGYTIRADLEPTPATRRFLSAVEEAAEALGPRRK